jgi:hypothetical protein
MNRKKILGMLAITIVVAAIGSVAAFGGKFTGIDPQSRDNITNAIKANNYSAWQAAMSAQLTPENFNKIVQNYQTMSQRHGNMSQWRGNMTEKQGTMYAGKQALNAGMIQAIKDNSYPEWTAAILNSTSPLVSKINNETQFNTLVALYQAKQDGNNTQVMALSQQLGLSAGNGYHKMSRRFRR